MSKRTLVEKHGSQYIYKADTTYPIPNVDLLTLLFEHPQCGAKENAPVHVDAENPSLALTKASARTLTKRIAHALRTQYNVGPIAHSKGTKGAKKKDYVTCISAGNYLVPALFYGVVAAGGIFSSVTASATVEELERLIKLAPSELIITGVETKDVTLAAAKRTGIPLKNVLIVDVPNVALRRASDGKDILTDKELNWRKITNKQELENTPLCLIYSSGTTGLPKGVPLSHLNMVAECILGCDPIKNQKDFEYKTIAHLPVAHIAGMQGYFVNPFYMGGPTYWMSKFDFPKFLEYNKKYGITFFFTVPPIYLLIAKMPQVTDQFDTLRVAISGAAPMGKDLQYAASAKLGKGETFISQTWGLSESTGSATLLGYGERDDTGSVSRLLPNCIARMVDEDGHDVEPGKDGELWLQGPVIFKGYHNNPVADRDSFENGWYKTGDVGVFKNGLFYIVDRRKELIKYKGMQVAPAELEALLISHDDILDAAVIGIDAEGGNEVPRAYVVADPKKISEQEIKDFVKENVAQYKQLRGGVVFLEAIPKSPSGKILRKDLRALANKEAPKAKL